MAKSAANIAKSLFQTLLKEEVVEDVDLVCSNLYLRWMCEQVINNPDWEEDKSHRWVGYVQGVMVSKGITSVYQERERVRTI